MHHAVPQGNDRGRITRDATDRDRLAERIAIVATDRDWRLLAWSILDTHAHLVIETPQPDLGAGMKRILGGHSHAMHLRHGGSGALFVPRFWSTRIVDELQLLRAVLYVDLNPVAAGLASHPGRYRWGSYATAGPCALIGLLGETREAARARYAEIVDAEAERVRGRRAELPRTVERVLQSARGAAPSG